MGLASGGGSRNNRGYRGGSGFALGYLFAKNSGGEGAAMAASLVGAGAVVLLTAAGVAGIIMDGNKVKEYKSELNQTIAATMEYKSVDATYFDWFNNNDEEFIFKFTGNAINNNDEKIDFFSCSYSVSEQQYYDVLRYIEQNNIEDLDTKGLLKKLNGIIKEAEVVKAKENPTITTSANEDNRVILNVSKAKVNGDKVTYYVCYAKEDKDEKGNLGLTTTIDEVSYDLTEELTNNPNGVFALKAEDAKVKILKSSFAPIKSYNVQALGNTPKSKSRM